MAADTLTLALNGDVPLRTFAQAIDQFTRLVDALSGEVAREAAIEWLIDDLQAGSAIATVRGQSERAEVVARVTAAYMIVGRALSAGQPIPYSDRVKAPARALTQLLDNRVTSLRFETPEADVVVGNTISGEQNLPPIYAYGVLHGTVQTLSRQRTLRFVVYDPIYDRPVTCYLKAGEEDKVRDLWGRRVAVAGRIARDARTGRAFSVREITTVRLDEPGTPGSYKRARGVWAGELERSPLTVLRESRDG
jgi:hypothetical protein